MPRSYYVTELTIPALVRKGRARLLDRDGRAICTIRLARLGIPPASAIEELRWKNWAKQKTLQFFWSSHKPLLDPWQKRAYSLVVSFRLRRRGCPPRSQRKLLDNFVTINWHDASIRMTQQAWNRLRRYDRSGWDRWSHTMSCNQNRRAERIYWQTRRT